MDPDIEKILDKYKSKLNKEVKTDVNVESYNPERFSSEYTQFRKESLTKASNIYENLSNFAESIIRIKSKDKDKELLQEAINATHLNITPNGAASFATLTSGLITLFGLALVILSFLGETFNQGLMLFALILMLLSFIAIKPLTKIPVYIASRWRLRASNQMVLCVLYVVMYMRHTSNLEHAIKFASDHINSPLNLDLRKILWDTESGKYTTIKESLDRYLSTWKNYNPEFVESFNLIQGSLIEPDEARRVSLLEKSLDVILEGTYERMLHYAQGLKNPITMLHMLGIVLPILGLVILPLMGSFIGGSGSSKIIFLVVLYNVFLPLIVYIIGTNILSKRPTGYNDVELLPEAELKKLKNILIKVWGREIQINPLLFCFIIFAVISSIGLIPIFSHFANPSLDFSYRQARLIDFRESNGLPCENAIGCFGPFGFGSVLLSLFIPLGIALSIGTYYWISTRKLIKIRNETRNLEKEFSGSLFQLGNRIGDGIPTEVAFGSVSQNLKGTNTGNFFSLVSRNIITFGMSIKDAIFNPKNGAIWQYPSSLIETSMKVLIESAKKGPKVAARSLTSISTYVSRIHSVNERLKDILSDVISSMKSQINFLTPVIAGIVVGISSMIITLLIRLSEVVVQQTQAQGNVAGIPAALPIDLFSVPNIIPSYYLQLIVGIYVIQVIAVLTVLLNGIENGPDKVARNNSLGKNLYIGILLYTAVTFIVTLIFTLLALAINLGI